MIFLALGIAISLEFSAGLTANAAHQAHILNHQVSSAAMFTGQLGSDAQFIRLARGNGDADKDKGKIGNGDKSDKPDLRYVDWSKSSSVQKKNGNGNGEEKGEDDEDEGEKEEQEKDEEEGFDRLWDVVHYG